MPLTGVRIVGMPALNRRLTTSLGAIPKETRSRMRKAGNIVRDEMRRRAPVQTGKLRQSVATRLGTRRSTLGIGGTGIQAVAMTTTVSVGSLRRLRDAPGGKLKKVFWDRFIEGGTRPHAQPKFLAGRTHPGTRAQPYIAPSVEATKDAVLREIGQVFKVI